MKNKKNLLSVIVPAYRQEKTIQRDLHSIEEALKKIRYDYEIICVVDGKIDDTFKNAKKISSNKIKVVAYKKNHGKGYAVRYGMVRTKGDLVAFIDSGMDLDPSGVSMLLEHMLWYNSDVIVGSIRHSASKVYSYPLKRRIYSWGYHLFTKFLFGLRITDSQRGLKIFKKRVLEKVLPRLLVKKFAFDIEMLAVAHRLGFRKIHDGPVVLDGSKLKFSNVNLGTIWNMIIDTLAVFYRLKIIHYYDDSSRRKWFYDKDLQFKVNVA